MSEFYGVRLVSKLLVALACLTIATGELAAQGSEDLQAQFDELESDFAEQSLRLGNKAPRKADRKLRAESSQRALELLDECEDAELAFEILNWIVKQNRGNRSYRKAHEVMVEDYLDQPGIGNVFSQSTTTEVLESALVKNDDPEVKAIVHYLLAIRMEELEKSEPALKKVNDEYGHYLYRGTSIFTLVRVELTSIESRKRTEASLKGRKSFLKRFRR